MTAVAIIKYSEKSAGCRSVFYSDLQIKPYNILSCCVCVHAACFESVVAVVPIFKASPSRNENGYKSRETLQDDKIE